MNSEDFTKEGLEKLAIELDISLKEVCQGLDLVGEKIFGNDFLLGETSNCFTNAQIAKLFKGRVYSTDDELFFGSRAIAISKALHDCNNVSGVSEVKGALKVLDELLLEGIKEAKTIHQLSMLYYTTRDGSKAKKPALEKIYELLNS
jgi:hypothetical protein